MIKYRVYEAPDGGGCSFCGEYDTYEEAVEEAEKEPGGLPEYMWDTEYAIGNNNGKAPEGGEEHKVISWHGKEGWHCVVPVTYEEDDETEKERGGVRIYGESLSKKVIEASKRLDGRRKSNLCNEDYDKERELEDMKNMLIGKGYRFSGNHPEEFAEDWIDNGFTVGSAESWMDEGFWDAETASIFVSEGLTPEHVGDLAEILYDEHKDYYTVPEYPYSDPIYAVCNGDLDPQEIIDMLEIE